MSIYVPPRPALKAELKAGPIGPGAGVLMTEFPLMSILGGKSVQEKMWKALQIATDAAWPETAEDAIGTAITGQPWVLEDADETEIDDAYPDPQAQRLLLLLERPQAHVTIGSRYTRSELWQMTLRHMGLCGNAFWYLDQRDALADTPDAILYVQPWRMTPNEDAKGNLLSWQIDKSATSPGLTIELSEVVHFRLGLPDKGHFGRGMVERALLKAQNSVGFDRHLAQVLSAGGRLSGLLSPKAGESINDTQYNQLVADARTVVEQPDAAKRLQILRGPIEFVPTTMTIADLQLVELMKLMRDDLLSIWGVPAGYVVPQAAGLNSGEGRKYDKQILWENANHLRVVRFSEAIQQGIVDRWQGLGVVVDFEIEEPEFDDDSARFDLLGKSLNTPLRNRERRALVGLEPFGDKVVNPVTGLAIDEEVWLPLNIVEAYAATEEKAMATVPQVVPVAPAEPNIAVATAAGETSTVPKQQPAKARLTGLHSSLVKLRRSLDDRITPRVKQSVAQVLEEQRREIIARVKGAAEHLMRKPTDTKPWWDGPKWDRRMNEAMRPHLINMAEQVDGQIRPMLGAQKAGPVAAVDNALRRGATRVTRLNGRTRDAIVTTIRETVSAGIEAGRSPAEVGDALEIALSGVTLENGTPAFDEYRAEMIARTEMTAAYNDAALGSYADADITQVEAIDGDEDPECAERNGRTFSVEEAGDIEDHPNGTLDWLPVIGKEIAA